MDYTKIHDQIIERAKNRKVEGYTENHHIIPKCMGGTDDKENLVELTAREHFIIHKLLCEIYPEESGLKYAVWLMCNIKNEYQKRNYKISSREYERLKIIHTSNVSNHFKKWHKNANKSNLLKRNRKIKETLTGRKRPEISGENHYLYGKSNPKHSKRMTGEKNPAKRKEVREKISNSLIGRSRPKLVRDKISKATKGGKNPNAKKVVHIETGNIFDTMTEASGEFDVSLNTISNHCNDKVKNKKFKFVK